MARPNSASALSGSSSSTLQGRRARPVRTFTHTHTYVDGTKNLNQKADTVMVLMRWCAVLGAAERHQAQPPVSSSSEGMRVLFCVKRKPCSHQTTAWPGATPFVGCTGPLQLATPVQAGRKPQPHLCRALGVFPQHLCIPADTHNTWAACNTRAACNTQQGGHEPTQAHQAAAAAV